MANLAATSQPSTTTRHGPELLRPKSVGEESHEHVEPLADPQDVKLVEELVSMARDILDSSSVPGKPDITASTPLVDAGMDSLHAMKLLRSISQRGISLTTAAQDQHVRLKPSLSQLLDPSATIQSLFLSPIEACHEADEQAAARSQLADFSSRHMAAALDKLQLDSATDIEFVLPATSTQSQLALSFAVASRSSVSHAVLRLRSGISAMALKEAVEAVMMEQPIYRCALLPCDEPLAPFAQAVLTPAAWRRLGKDAERIVLRKPSAADGVGDAQRWLDLAEARISLDSQRLYHVQVIGSASGNDGLLVISVANFICDYDSLDVLTSDVARRFAGLESLPRQGLYDVVLKWVARLSPDNDNLWRKMLKGLESESFGSLSGDNVKSDTNSVHETVQYENGLSWKNFEDSSRAIGASPLAVLQGAWALLLNLLSEADTGDITFGSVISAHDVRTHAPTVCVVPCRVGLPQTQTTSQLLGTLTSQSRFIQCHQHTSFGIFESQPFNTALALQVRDDVLTSPEGPGSHLEAVSVPWTDVSYSPTGYNLDIFAEVLAASSSVGKDGQDNNVTFRLTYQGDVLSKLAATSIVKQFAALTEIILASSPQDLVQGLVARLPKELLSAEGTIPLTAGKNESEQTQDRTELLHRQFEVQAASTPDRLALSFHTRLDSSPVELSYGELDARANGLANILREENVDIIPICMQRSAELYVAILAILKAGSAWCPIDETSPIQRRTSLIARTMSKIILTTTESLFLIEPCLAQESLKGMRVILIDQYANLKTPKRAQTREALPCLRGSDLAYLIWTSGTTGEPKGVMIPHSAATAAMVDLQHRVEHEPQSPQVRTLQLSASSFDVFVQDLFYTWGLAGSVISGGRELLLGTFTEFIWKAQPTHAHLTPSFGASINVEMLRGSALQYVTFIGEKLTEDVAEAWAAPGITTRAYNTYGPAENAVVSTMRRFYGKSRDRAKAANVGFPLGPCTAYVVREVAVGADSDEKRWELVPRYGVGELALGGAQVAKGYLSNEAKTTKAFIQGGPGIDERIYLTGDMVRLNDHGFEFLGRNDDLVKIAGIRIELSEISAACASIKDVDAAVEHVETLFVPRPGASADANSKVVVTFVSVKNDGVDTSLIRRHIFQRARDLLPTYMVPGHIVVLETTMPRTASNKVDRKVLQEIYNKSDLSVLASKENSKQLAGQQHTTTQWIPEQLPVLQIIGKHFHIPVEPLARGDTLAGLGFSSLQVIKLAWALKRELSCQVGALDLMECQLLGELVDAVSSKLAHQADPQLLAGHASLPMANGTDLETETSWLSSTKQLLTKNLYGAMRPQDTAFILPATPIQESLVVETMLEPRAYWLHRVFDLSHLGDIDCERLEAAWTAAAVNFHILRTIFVSLTQLDVESSESSVSWAREHGIRSTILQVIRKEPALRWTLLSANEGKILASKAEELQIELAPTTTDQPPWAVTFAPGEAKMMLSIHHALYDNVSSGILLDTVANLYQKQAAPKHQVAVVQLERGMELGLLPSTSQRDDAALLWSRRLADLSKTAGALNAPFPDLTQSRHKQPQGIRLATKSIPAALLALNSTTPALPMLLQSAFGCVLASYLELKAVVFGQTVSQRIIHPDLALVMGPAMATVPVVVRADATSAEALWREMAHDAAVLFRSTHSLHPVDIKKLLNQDSGSSGAPFPGLFVYHPATAEDAEDSRVDHNSSMFREVGEALSLCVEHPLAFKIFEGDMTMELTGEGRRISQAQLELMLDQIIDQARTMVESPQVPLAQLQNRMSRGLLSVSGEAGAQQITTSDPTASVAMYASSHPEWIAAEEFVFQESEEDEDAIVSKVVTYAELDKLTNAITFRLTFHEVGLQPDDVVALHLGRDIKSLAATLAIFRAGYVYLPIDEDLPTARKQLLISDAKARLVITTKDLVQDLGSSGDTNSPALLLLDVCDDDIESMLSWPVSQRPANGGYLIYTSGSTGRPKGVRVSNSNLCHFIAGFSARLLESSPATGRLGSVGKYLNTTSRAFDPHLTQLFVPWHLGHRVVIGKDRKAVLGSLQQVINELGITHFGSVPSVLTQLRLRPEDVPSVRVVTTGGEKASSELLDTWSKGAEIKDHPVLFNFYGPTEVTIGCLGHAVNPESNARNLGLPFAGLQALLLAPGTGDEQNITRRGQPGELCIAGPQVAMGYLDRPEENAKSFQNTSLLGTTAQKIYRTGDMMRMMHDGTLEFLGRTDQQAKIRGQRLELDEVVTFLKGAAATEKGLDFAAAVVENGQDATQRQQQLFGFVARNSSGLLKIEMDAELEMLPSPGRAVTTFMERLETASQKELPAFMVPTLLWVSRIPYLPASGKVDTKLLTKLANDFLDSQERQKGRETVVKVEQTSLILNAEETSVVVAVEEAVGNKIKATATSSIHRLGIDSLSAVHLVALLRKRGFSKLNMVDVLSPSCTVRSIARVSDRDWESGTPMTGTSSLTHHRDGLRQVNAMRVTDLDPLPAGLAEQAKEAVLPCLPLQAALVARSFVWLSSIADIDEKEDSATAEVPYVAHFHYRLSPGTDIARWKRAAEVVVKSEAMLRTCFIQREDDGRVFQVVLRSPPCSPFDGPGNSSDIVAKMNVRPPMRIEVQVDEKSGEIVASLRIHHALFDGVAIDLLRRKLEQAYNNEDTVSSPVDNNSLRSLTRISAHCNLSDVQMESTRRFWQSKLSDMRPCHVGAHHANKDNDSMARSTSCLAWTTTQLKAKLHARSSQSGVSISASSAFQLATALCLAQLTSQTSVVFGFVMSLRPLLDHITEGVDEFLGPCLNTLVESITLDKGDETLSNLAHKVQEAHVAACQGTIPFASVEQVQRWAASEDKLFDSLLSINIISSEDAPADAPVPGRMSALRTDSKSDMALAIDVDLHHDGRIVLTLSSAGALSTAELNHLGQLFEKILCSIANKAARVNEFVTLEHAVATQNHLLANGPASTTSSMDEDYQEAWHCVQKILCRLLRLSPAEMQDKAKTTTLYQIGLDSITVLPFVKMLNKSERLKVTADAVIRARTVQGTVQLVQEARKEKSASVVNDIPESNGLSRRDPEKNNYNVLNDSQTYDKTLARLAKDVLFVATPLQEGMLSASLAITDKAYRYTHTIQLSDHALEADTVDLDAFFAAVNDTVQACEILRTRFIFTQDDEAPWVGVVSPTDASDLVHWKAMKPRGRIQLTLHHALYDATSIRAVWKILDSYYRRRLTGEAHEYHEEDSTTQYLFASFARTVALNQRSAVAFWTDLVQDYRYSPLSLAGESLDASSAFCFTLKAQTLLLLQTRCRKASVTIKAALQLSWVKVLCEALYGQPDVVYGEVITTGTSETQGSTGVVGPTINTVPMRVRLGDHTSLEEGLVSVQKLCDDARGGNSMASLRKIQTAWRTSQTDGAATLFQSLFVFDGLLDPLTSDESASPPLFGPASQTETHDGENVGEPAYDDYPLIVSFHMKNNALNGKFRAKMTRNQVEILGRRLEAAVNNIVSDDLQRPVLAMSQIRTNGDSNVASHGNANHVREKPGTEMNDMTPKADAVLEVVKTVLGSRSRGRELHYNTKLVNAGLDSILAIRVSSLLRKRMGMKVSVFDIIRGASVHDIVKKNAAVVTSTADNTTGRPQAQPLAHSNELKTSIANELELSVDLIESIFPVLPGQRFQLEQWLHNGKRFLEPPWVYRLVNPALDFETVTKCWTSLCRVHDVLRSTFVHTGPDHGLVQVTLTKSWSAAVNALQDLSKPIEALIESHVRDGNSNPSDLRLPPVHLSFLKGLNGQAIVLRAHHVLYDAWSIKMIERDLNTLLFSPHTSSQFLSATPAFESVVREIIKSRQPAAENDYWTEHLLNAQDTVVVARDDAISAPPSSLGPHFKASYPSLVPLSTIHPHASAAITLAFAKTLTHFTHVTRPTFGLQHASRSLAGLDLTAARGPLLTMTPFSIDLSASSGDEGELLGFVQTHLAHLTKFAQAEDLQRLSPRYNTYLNILYSDDVGQDEEPQGIARHRLPENLASDYFTITGPMTASVSTIEGLEIPSYICAHQLFFTVIVRPDQGISLGMSGDEGLFGQDLNMRTKVIEVLQRELRSILESLDWD